MYIRALALLLFLTRVLFAQEPTPILPDANTTPGDTFDVATQDICAHGYARKVRDVPAEMKREVYREYGIISHGPGDYEIDHLLSGLTPSGSLKLGVLQATSVMRTLQIGDRSTKLAQAVAELGRIDKTIHALTYIDDEAKRRRILNQLNKGENRHKFARAVFHGKQRELRQRYREGQEDQLSSLQLEICLGRSKRVLYW